MLEYSTNIIVCHVLRFATDTTEQTHFLNRYFEFYTNNKMIVEFKYKMRGAFPHTYYNSTGTFSPLLLY
jgi:hypothetical protein